MRWRQKRRKQVTRANRQHPLRRLIPTKRRCLDWLLALRPPHRQDSMAKLRRAPVQKNVQSPRRQRPTRSRLQIRTPPPMRCTRRAAPCATRRIAPRPAAGADDTSAAPRRATSLLSEALYVLDHSLFLYRYILIFIQRTTFICSPRLAGEVRCGTSDLSRDGGLTSGSAGMPILVNWRHHRRDGFARCATPSA